MRRLLGWVLPRREREHLLGEMDDLYARRAGRQGRARATTWYLRHVAGFAVRMPARRVARGTRRVQGWAGSLARDLVLGFRALRRRPGYTLASLLTLGVGIGGVSAVHGAANWTMLRPVPGVTGDRLVTLRMEVVDTEGGPGFTLSHPDLESFRRGLRSLDGLAASAATPVHIDVGDGSAPLRGQAAIVTRNYFDLLGVVPARGRVFGPSDVAEGPAAVVLSHGLWRSRLGADPGVVGRTLRLNGVAFQVVGVAPPGFRGAELPGRFDLWVPPEAAPLLDPQLPADVLDRRGRTLWRDLVGRLAPGATSATIEGDARAVMERVRSEHEAYSFTANFRLVAYEGLGLEPRVRRSARRTLTMLGVTAAMLLLLAVANVTNLALTHAMARSQGTAVHKALGAGRRRIVQRILVEQLVLGLMGALVGLAAAWGGTTLFRHASLSGLGASLQGMTLDRRVVIFTLAASVVAGLLAGIGPALLTTGGRVLETLQGVRHGTRSTRRLQAVLVAAQVALSAVLLVGAGLLAQTVANLRGEALGIDPHGAVRFAVDPRLQDPSTERVLDLLGRLSERLLSEPGVQRVGFASPTPLSGSYLTLALQPPGESDENRRALGSQIGATPGFLEALGVRLLAGRLLRPADLGPGNGGQLSVAPGRREGTGEGPGPDRSVAVLTRSYAEAIFPGLPPEAAVGRMVEMSYGEIEPMRVVGVIDDVRLVGFDREAPPVAVLPWDRIPSWAGPVVGWVRTVGAPESLVPRIPTLVREVEPGLPTFEVRTSRAQVDTLIAEERVVARLAVILGLMGVILAGVGLHGVLGYAVADRTREIGVRVALGASPRALMRGVVGRGLVLTATGVVAGLGGAAVLARLIRSRLFGVDALEPVTYLAAVAVLMLVSGLASWRPARRAMRISPREALTAE